MTLTTEVITLLKERVYVHAGGYVASTYHFMDVCF